MVESSITNKLAQTIGDKWLNIFDPLFTDKQGLTIDNRCSTQKASGGLADLRLGKDFGKLERECVRSAPLRGSLHLHGLTITCCTDVAKLF